MTQLEFEALLSLYDYQLPEELIANVPANPRTSAKILVYNRANQKVVHDTFANIGQYLPSKSLLILNETKVVPARLILKKSTGGAVKILVLKKEGDHIVALADRKIKPGDVLMLSLNAAIEFTVISVHDSNYILKPSFNVEELDSILEDYGEAPLPPYIKTTLSSSQVKEEYQSVFAKTPGSIAAPTASLHFDDALLNSLEAAGHAIVKITLHVHLGTFLPLKLEQLESGRLHEEWFEISAEAKSKIESAISAGRQIIPVGTTALRAIESAFMGDGRSPATCPAKLEERSWKLGRAKLEGIKVGPQTTNIFIKPGYDFKVASGLITNFHVPKSSLMMLVASMIGREKLLELYHEAMKEKYRFFSFGDGMLVL